MASNGIQSEILTKCSPVTGIKEIGSQTEYVIDSSIVVDLEIVNFDKGLVICPLYENGRCRGKEPCIVNDLVKYTTVVAGAERR